MLDSVREIETPEGISLRLCPAGPLPRARAWMIDSLIRLVLLMLGMVPLSLLGTGGRGLAMLLMFALLWAYWVICELWLDGQSLGKRALGLRVVNLDGTPVTWLPSVTRNLLRVVDALPGVYGVGLASTLADPCARRLGDVVAGTMVVHVKEPAVGQQV
ncbi:MAG TPA: RDD family protein, partial [Rhodanobacter sp.]